MKFWSAILCVFICQAGPVLVKAQKPSGSSELRVRVKSSEGPVEGAAVVLTSKFAGQRINVTNAEGSCEFRGLQAGTYSLQVVQRSLFPTEEAEQQMSGLEIANAQSQSVNLYLVKGGVLKGRVASIEGSPVIGIPISALQLGGKQPALPSTKESNATAVSDDRGEFRIYGLRPGRYTVAVNTQRNSSQLKSVAALFYPGERESAKATAFELVSGQEVTIPDMILDLTSANQNSLLGKVQGSDGKSLSGVSLTLMSVDGSQVTDSSVTDDQGHFSFEGLPAGQYLLKTRFNSGSHFNLERQVSVKDLETNNVILELKPYPLISGRAYLKSKNEVVSLPSLKFQLEPAQTGGKKIELLTDKDGIFSQRSGDEGLYWWGFPELRPDYFVNRILLDGKDITNRAVKLDRTTDLRGISVEVGSGGAEIRGPVQGATCEVNSVYAVALHPKSDEIQFVRKANCSVDSFKIQSLAPGRYYVIGTSNRDALEHAVKTLKTRGVKAVELDRGQVLENAQAIMIDGILSPGN